MSSVCLKRIDFYSANEISNFLEECKLNLSFSSDKILIKPNLLSFKKPEKCVNTHPIFFEGIVKFFKNFNVKIFVGDNPGFGTLKANLKISGYNQIIKKYGLKIYEFNNKIKVKNDRNKILKNFEISDAVNFDFIVNIPKLKTHCMMGLTLAVKNCFGFIVGKDKISYHLKAGHDKIFFANILIDIYETVKPDLNIIDGIWGMEGDGPSSGEPANFKIAGISKCGYSLDFMIENLVGFGETLITKHAGERKLFKKEDVKINLIGERFFVKKIKPSKSKPANFRIPRFLSNLIYPKPVILHDKCRKCYTCLKSCPAKAIFENEVLKIDYKKCIRCYCCHELCVHEAIELK